MENVPLNAGGARYRLDRFRVPQGAREEFLRQIRRTHGFLQQLPGFASQAILERPLEPGFLQIATIVAWADEESLAFAKSAMAEIRSRDQFDPARFLEANGIDADLGEFRTVPIEIG